MHERNYTTWNQPSRYSQRSTTNYFVILSQLTTTGTLSTATYQAVSPSNRIEA